MRGYQYLSINALAQLPTGTRIVDIKQTAYEKTLDGDWREWGTNTIHPSFDVSGYSPYIVILPCRVGGLVDRWESAKYSGFTPGTTPWNRVWAYLWNIEQGEVDPAGFYTGEEGMKGFYYHSVVMLSDKTLIVKKGDDTWHDIVTNEEVKVDWQYIYPIWSE